jgi:hypothetical protein
MTLRAWTVYRKNRNGDLIPHDTVYMDAPDAETVRLSLINHDGLPPDIVVKYCKDIHKRKG